MNENEPFIEKQNEDQESVDTFDQPKTDEKIEKRNNFIKSSDIQPVHYDIEIEEKKDEKEKKEVKSEANAKPSIGLGEKKNSVEKSKEEEPQEESEDESNEECEEESEEEFKEAAEQELKINENKSNSIIKNTAKVEPEDYVDFEKLFEESKKIVDSIGALTCISISTVLSVPAQLRVEMRLHNTNLIHMKYPSFLNNFKKDTIKFMSYYSNKKFDPDHKESNNVIFLIICLIKKMFSNGFFVAKDVSFVLDLFKQVDKDYFKKHIKICLKILGHCILLINDNEITKVVKANGRLIFINMFHQNDLLSNKLSDVITYIVLSQNDLDLTCQDELQFIIWSTLFTTKDVWWRNIQINMKAPIPKPTNIFEEITKKISLLDKNSDKNLVEETMKSVQNMNISDSYQIYYNGTITALINLLTIHKSSNSCITSRIFQTIYGLIEKIDNKKMIVSELLSDNNFESLDVLMSSKKDAKSNTDLFYFLSRVFNTREAAEVALDHQYFCASICENLKNVIGSYFQFEKNRDNSKKHEKYRLIMMVKLIKNIIKFWQGNEFLHNKWKSMCLVVQEILFKFVIQKSIPWVRDLISTKNLKNIAVEHLMEPLKKLKSQNSFEISTELEELEKNNQLNGTSMGDETLINYVLSSKDNDQHIFTSLNFKSMVISVLDSQQWNSQILIDVHIIILQTFNYSVMEVCKTNIYESIFSLLKNNYLKIQLLQSLFDSPISTKLLAEIMILQQNFLLLGYDKTIDPYFSDLIYAFEIGRSSQTLCDIQSQCKAQSQQLCQFTQFDKLSEIKPVKILKAFFLPYLKIRAFCKKYGIAFNSIVKGHYTKLKIFMMRLKNFINKKNGKEPDISISPNQNVKCESSIDEIISEILEDATKIIPDDFQIKDYELKLSLGEDYINSVNQRETLNNALPILKNYVKMKQEYTQVTYEKMKHHLLVKLNDKNVSQDVYNNFIKYILGSGFFDSENYDRFAIWQRLYNFNQILRVDFTAKRHVYNMLKFDYNNQQGGQSNNNILQNNCYIIYNCWKLYYQLNLFVSWKIQYDYLWKEQVDNLKLLAKTFQSLCEDNYIPFKDYFGTYIVHTEYALKISQFIKRKFVPGQILYEDERNFKEVVGGNEELTLTPFIQIILLYKYCNMKSLPGSAAKRILATLTEMVTGPCQANQKFMLQGLSTMIPQQDKFSSYFGDLNMSGLAEIDKSNLNKNGNIIFAYNILQLFLAVVEDQKLISDKNKSQSFKWWKPETFARAGIKFLELYNQSKHLNKNISLQACNHKTSRSLISLLIGSSKNCPLHPDRMEELYKNDFSKPKIMQIISNIYQLLIQLADNYSQFDDYLKDKSHQFAQTMTSNFDPNMYTKEQIHEIYFIEFCKRIISSVEVNIHNQFISEKPQLVRFTFLKNPISNYLSNRTKQKFMNNVNIDTHEFKIMGLLDNADIFYDEMNVGMRKAKYSKMLFYLFSPDIILVYARLLFVDIVIINILIVAMFEWKPSDSSGSGQLSGTNAIDILVLIIICINIALSVVYLVGWIITSFGLKDINQYRFIETGTNKNKFKVMFNYLFRLVYGFISFFIFNNVTPVFIFIIAASALYLGTHMPVFLGVQLLVIFAFSSTLQSLLSAIIQSGLQLLITFILGIFIIYCYSLLAAQRYKDNLMSQNTLYGSEDTYCYDMLGCFLHVFNIGIRKAGVGDGLIYPSYRMGEDKIEFLGLFSFSMSFFILVNIIILNVVLAIITDSFGAQRNSQELRGNFQFFYQNIFFRQRQKKQVFYMQLRSNKFSKRRQKLPSAYKIRAQSMELCGFICLFKRFQGKRFIRS